MVLARCDRRRACRCERTLNEVAPASSVIAPVSSLAATPSLTPVTVTVRVAVSSLADVAGQRVGHRDGRGFADGQASGSRRRASPGSGCRPPRAVASPSVMPAPPGAARRHRAGDGDGVGGAGIGIEHVVGDDREHGRRGVLGHAAGIVDRLRQVVGAVDRDRQGGGVRRAGRVLDGVVEDVGERVEAGSSACTAALFWSTV